MITYLREHWLGKQDFSRAVGLNVILLNTLIVFLFGLLIHWVELNRKIPSAVLVMPMLVCCVAMLIWQSVGAFRSATRRIQNNGSSAHYYVVLMVILISGFTILGNLATLSGGYVDYDQKALDSYQTPERQFVITSSPSGHVSFRGEIDHGATKELREIVHELPKGATLSLESLGGLIVEARGMANVVHEFSLHTHVAEQCFSACTLVFIAGAKRTLAEKGSLGFHQYDVYSRSKLPWIVPEDEQNKDVALFREKQVPEWFLEKAYSEPHDSIWLPSRDELISAGIIMRDR